MLRNHKEQESTSSTQTENSTSELKLTVQKPSNDPQPMNDRTKTIDLTGMGGYQKEINQIMRAIFSHDLLGNLAAPYGVQSPKGILLVGPPGTGKTRIACLIANAFPHGHVTTVSGPELKNKYHGQSEENLRNLFTAAKKEWDKKKEKSNKHLLIFDEIDTVFPNRSTDPNARADNSMTAQMLAIMDGADSLGNILVIGTTNFKASLDPALLRPGRFEMAVTIGLPSKEDRYDILLVKTQVMRKAGLLDAAVDLDWLAMQTEGFSCAELDFLVRKAGEFASEKHIEITRTQNAVSIQAKHLEADQLTKVADEHFEKAFAEIRPTCQLKKMRDKPIEQSFTETKPTLPPQNPPRPSIFRHFQNNFSSSNSSATPSKTQENSKKF